MPVSTLLPAITPCPIELLRWTEVPHPERAVARNDLVRVRHGVFAPRDAWQVLAPWDRYRARVYAAHLTHRDAVFCLESAAALTGMPIFGDPGPVHVLIPPNGSSRLSGGIRAHTGGPDRGIHEVAGLAFTTVADTAVDLARSRHRAIGLAGTDAALRLDRSLQTSRMMEINEGRSSSRGRAIARWAIDRARAEAETALESVSRAVIEWLGFPEPHLQVTFRSSAGAEDRSDFVWPGYAVAGEADGDLKFDGRFGSPTLLLEKQRQRDHRLRAHVRAVVHWAWADAITFTPLRSLLTSAGLTVVHPEDTAQLLSLQRTLRPRAAGPTVS